MTENVKCPECKLVNWGTAQNCRRCNASLAGIPFSHTSLHQNESPKVTSTNEEQVIADFQARRTRQWLLGIPLIPVIFCAMWLKSNPDTTIMGFGATTLIFISVLAVIGALVFSYFNWRCPSCNAYLGKSPNPSFCQQCGVKLR